MSDIPEVRPLQAPPSGERQPNPASVRPPYLDEDPWTSSAPPKDESHWTRVRQLLNKCDGDVIGSWQEEINTQLIVVSDASLSTILILTTFQSSLLSALTGAFVIETQKDLSEDPVVTAAVLLSHIAMQLNASIALPPSTLQSFSNPSPNARAVNSLLYVSLGFSLSNVTLGLLCLQWLRELKSDTPGVSDRYYSSLHSTRHIGFQKWGAKALVNTLPLLLLSSLACFFAGLLFHVSTIDWVTSLPVSVVLGVTFGVLVLTTLLPAVVVAGCAAFHGGALVGGYPPIPPYHSLQSWIALQLTIAILRNPVFKVFNTVSYALKELKNCPDWGRINLFWQTHTSWTDPILLPLIHSSSNSARMDDVALCLRDTRVLKQTPNGNLVKMNMETLRYFIEHYSAVLPSCTLIDIERKLIIQLIHYFNDGSNLADIGDLVFESNMLLHSPPSAVFIYPVFTILTRFSRSNSTTSRCGSVVRTQVTGTQIFLGLPMEHHINVHGSYTGPACVSDVDHTRPQCCWARETEF